MPPDPRVEQSLRRIRGSLATQFHDDRVGRSLTLAAVAERAGVATSVVHAAEAGRPVSLESTLRIAYALGRRLDLILTDTRRRSVARPGADTVHSAMGEVEAARLRPFGFSLAIDEPYQHYQFAGRADLLAWDIERRTLLHLENRTQFPDVQDAAGSFNAKRAYLAAVLSERLGTPP